MGALKRLPNGYRDRVITLKNSLQEIFIQISNLDAMWDNKVNILKTTPGLQVSNIYLHENYRNVMRIDFDYFIIGGHAKIDIKTGTLSLDGTCTVFMDDSENYVDNYKW